MEDEEKEDVLKKKTPDDVVAVLGFDPLDLASNEEIEEAE